MNWFKLILLLSIIGLNTSSVLAEQARFEKANEAYEQQDFNKASLIYQELVDEGFVALNLYYNLGNAYFKSNEIGKSILYFEKAQKLAPRNKDIAHNLKIAYNNTQDKIAPLPRLFFINWWYSILNFTSTSRWATYGIGFLWLAFMLALMHLFTKRKLFKHFALTTLSISLVLLFLAWQKNIYTNLNTKAIILQEEVELKSSPNNAAKEIGYIHEGLKVEIIDSVDLWYQIQIQDGNKAWVQKSTLAFI